ncbi:chitinase, partial [Streptomyces sp. SID4917]
MAGADLRGSRKPLRTLVLLAALALGLATSLISTPVPATAAVAAVGSITGLGGKCVDVAGGKPAH